MAVTEAQVRTAVGTYEVDAGHSTIAFRVDDTTDLIASINGRFTEFEGTIELADDIESSRFAGVVKTASVTTDNDKRNEHLQSPDFFDAGAYPEIRFDSTSVEAIDDERLRIAGALSIKDFSHDVELETRLIAAGSDRFGNDRVAFESTGGFEWGPVTVQLEVLVSAVKAA